MKILMISMPSIHFFRWTEQLKDSGHDIYWFNVTDSDQAVRRMDWINQHYGWRLKWDFPGRTRLKSLFPKLSKFIEKLNTNATYKAFENYLNQVKPDVVHSFVLYQSCVPILEVMKKYSHVSWIYSAWGNDLYYYQNFPNFKNDIVNTLPHLDFMFADCQRDIDLAYKLGFKGETLGVFPGGGGYDLTMIKEDLKQPKQRSGIIIKGYQGDKHRALNILKALERFNEIPKITIFSANEILIDYIERSDKLVSEKFKIYSQKESIIHDELCRMMNKHLIYIGNNLSDGMPNTLLEAICFGAFPIQSNPGDATAEIIENGVNGLLINDCEDVEHIKSLIEHALTDKILIGKAFEINKKIRKSLEFDIIKKQVLVKYQHVQNKLEC